MLNVKRLLLLSVFLSASTQAEFTLTDDAGVEHHFAQPVKRIVSLMPHGTELMFEVGAGELIVGAVQYSDFPPAAKQIPRVGGYSGLNIEAIAALNPDILLAWPDGNSQRELARLKQLGFRLFASDPVSYEDIANNLRRFGQMTGRRDQGEQAARQFMTEVTDLKQRYSAQPTLSVFYQVWYEPLLTQNKDTFISQAIELCGGHNIFAELAIRAPQVSKEAVLMADPDVIVASGMGESRPEWLDDWREYSHLKAVRSGSLYHIHPDFFNRPTSRFLVGSRQLCEQMDGTRQRRQQAAE